MNRSTPGLPVHHQLPEFTQTHVHWVNDAIQPSHPLSSPSPPAPNPSQHQGDAGWHHWLDGHVSEWTPGVGDGQGGLACCNSWGHKESDTTERLNWTELKGVAIPHSPRECSHCCEGALHHFQPSHLPRVGVRGVTGDSGQLSADCLPSAESLALWSAQAAGGFYLLDITLTPGTSPVGCCDLKLEQE